MSGKVCIVCLKSFQSIHNELPQGEYCGVALLTKFLKFTQNYLELPSSPTIQQLITSASDNHDDTSRDTFCEKCELAVINPICKVYLELISAQLRLSWELEHLEKLLDNSNRLVPTESGVANLKLLTEQLGADKVKYFEDFRNLLAQKCQLKRKVGLPQVLIGTRCDAQKTAFLETEAVYDDSEQVLEDPLAFDDAAPDPLDIQCGATFESNAEENFELEKIIKLEEFHVANEQEPIPEIEDEAPKNLPSTSYSVSVKLLNPSPAPKMDNFLNGEYECPTCGKILRNSAAFDVHDRYYHKSINCTICAKTFKGNKSLSVHIRRFHTHKLVSFPCRVCTKVFPTTSGLSLHMRAYHKPNQLQFRCSHCTASFQKRQNLLQHVAAIHKPGIFFCPHCPERVFSTKKYLRAHVHNLHGSLSEPGSTQPLQVFSS